MTAQPPPSEGTIVFSVDGLIARGDEPGLCERLRLALVPPGDRVVCDVGALVAPDVVAVGALARLQLTARRRGRHIRLERASPELAELIGFVGLDLVLPLGRSASMSAVTTIEIETPHGRALAHLHPAEEPRAALVLGHGAGGGVASRDLTAATGAALSAGVGVALVEQPYRVAGRRSP